jgi:hypothetical protein
MSWKTSKFASSFVSLFIDSAADEVGDSRIEVVRDAMLEAIQDIAASPAHDTLTRRLRWAPHAQALWYLRMDVMTLLSSERTEAQARQCLADITAQFRGLIYANQIARPSRLNKN